MGSMILFSKSYCSKNNSRIKLTSNMVRYRLVSVQVCVHELKEFLPIFFKTNICYTHGKVEELSLTQKKYFPGSSTLLCVQNKAISYKDAVCCVWAYIMLYQ